MLYDKFRDWLKKENWCPNQALDQNRNINALSKYWLKLDYEPAQAMDWVQLELWPPFTS